MAYTLMVILHYILNPVTGSFCSYRVNMDEDIGPVRLNLYIRYTNMVAAYFEF